MPIEGRRMTGGGKGSGKGSALRKMSVEETDWLVTRFAMYDKPADVIRKFKEEFEKDIPRETVRNYDLRSSRGWNKASKRNKDVFEATRQKYIDGVCDHPVSQMAYRVQLLGEMVEAAREMKNYKLVAELLEQVAKETGGVYTNELKVKGRVAHEHSGQINHVASIEEKRNILEDRLGDAMRRLPVIAQH